MAQDLLCADAGVPQLVAKPRVEPLRVLRTNQVEYDYSNQFDSNQCEFRSNLNRILSVERIVEAVLDEHRTAHA